MEANKWTKIEDEDGYPCYINESTGKQQQDHPEFLKIIEKLKVYDGIKYGAYRIAFKIYELQKHLKVPCLRISLGVFRAHQLNLSESSLSLDTTGLESVLADIYFAARKDKETQFSGDVNLSLDLIINLLLNVHDKERKEPIRVLAVKTLLIILSEESASAKWAALANCAADHNGCVSYKRLAGLLSHVTALPAYLGTVPSTTTQLQEDVDACFEKNAGMVGVTTRAVAEWGEHSSSTRWLPVVQRVATSRQMSTATVACSNCNKPLIQTLKFQCTKCNEVYFCEKCYLYEEGGAGSAVRGHKKTHLVQEVIDGQSKIPQCVSLMRGMKRFFFCTKRKKRKNVKPRAQSPRRRPGIATSTVGRAGGQREGGTTTAVLQDIINQLETQDKVLQELSEQLKASDDANLKVKVDDHWSHISTQINRLKGLKSNLPSQADLPTESNPVKPDRPQAFDLFSPIPVVAKQSRVVDKQTKVADKQSKVADKFSNQPRVRSLDSGNFSVLSRSGSQHLLTVSGDALRPVLQTSDTISTVSINDISTWYNGQDSIASDRRQRQPSSLKPTVTLEANPAFTTTGPTDCVPVIPRGPADRVNACPAGPSDRREAFTPGPTDCLAACEAEIVSVEHSMKEATADLDTVLDRLHQMLANNFAMDESSFDNSQLRETASEMEGLLGTLIRGVEQRATLHARARATSARGLL